VFAGPHCPQAENGKTSSLISTHPKHSSHAGTRGVPRAHAMRFPSYGVRLEKGGRASQRLAVHTPATATGAYFRIAAFVPIFIYTHIERMGQSPRSVLLQTTSKLVLTASSTHIGCSVRPGDIAPRIGGGRVRNYFVHMSHSMPNSTVTVEADQPIGEAGVGDRDVVCALTTCAHTN
jgi:hypothetical protein